VIAVRQPGLAGQDGEAGVIECEGFHSNTRRHSVPRAYVHRPEAIGSSHPPPSPLERRLEPRLVEHALGTLRQLAAHYTPGALAEIRGAAMGWAAGGGHPSPQFSERLSWTANCLGGQG
jgi:hypothetical protein